MILGLDVSSCQGTHPDFLRAKEEGGVSFVIEKVTEGLRGVDPMARPNLAAARKAGLYVGVYHFAHVSEGQPDVQVQRLWESMGDQMPDLPPALDLESAPSSMPAQQIVDFARGFADACQRFFGRLPLIYSYPAFLDRLQPALAASDLARCPLWIAHYLWDQPGLPPPNLLPRVRPPWAVHTIWQCSGDHGPHVPGFATAVDRNVFEGDIAAFRVFCGLPDVSQSDPTIRIVHPDVPLDPPGDA